MEVGAVGSAHARKAREVRGPAESSQRPRCDVGVPYSRTHTRNVHVCHPHVLRTRWLHIAARRAPLKQLARGEGPRSPFRTPSMPAKRAYGTPVPDDSSVSSLQQCWCATGRSCIVGGRLRTSTLCRAGHAAPPGQARSRKRTGAQTPWCVGEPRAVRARRLCSRPHSCLELDEPHPGIGVAQTRSASSDDDCSPARGLTFGTGANVLALGRTPSSS